MNFQHFWKILFSTHIIRGATNTIVNLPISVDAIKWASLCFLVKAVIFNTYCKHTLTQQHCLKLTGPRRQLECFCADLSLPFHIQSPVALQHSQVAPMLIYNIFESVCQQSNPENMT